MISLFSGFLVMIELISGTHKSGQIPSGQVKHLQQIRCILIVVTLTGLTGPAVPQ